jgi:hypothetical protein
LDTAHVQGVSSSRPIQITATLHQYDTFSFLSKDPASLPSQEFSIVYLTDIFHQLLEPFFHLVYPYVSAITRAENKRVVDERSSFSILSVYYKKLSNEETNMLCSKCPQKRVPSNAAVHPTIETVGFQAAFSVKKMDTVFL